MTQPPAESDPDRPEREFPTVMEQLGGVPGIISTTLPIITFIVVNVATSLQPALIAAIAAGVLVAIWRLARKQPLMPAISGLLGVGVAVFFANQTGEARGFYLPGLITSAVLGLAFLISVLVKWPLAGVIWHGINGHGHSWRDNPRLRRAYTWASLLWAALFFSRLVLQGWLYDLGEETWLGIARLVMGVPLFGVALLLTFLAVRRANRDPLGT